MCTLKLLYPTCTHIFRWIFPFIGHMGICTSAGVIRDFAGPYYVSVSTYTNTLTRTRTYVHLYIHKHTHVHMYIFTYTYNYYHLPQFPTVNLWLVVLVVMGDHTGACTAFLWRKEPFLHGLLASTVLNMYTCPCSAVCLLLQLLNFCFLTLQEDNMAFGNPTM